jgi:hypothetical protein
VEKEGMILYCPHCKCDRKFVRIDDANILIDVCQFCGHIEEVKEEAKK